MLLQPAILTLKGKKGKLIKTMQCILCDVFLLLVADWKSQLGMLLLFPR